ncbi:hypothetical protein D3C81_1307260 [compost metagenome]
MTGQFIPGTPLLLDQLHGGKFAPRIAVRFIFGRVQHDHADALAHGPRHAQVDIVAAAQLLAVDEQDLLAVQVRLQIARQRLDEVILELVHERILAVCITQETAVADLHGIPLFPVRPCHRRALPL